MGEVDLILIDDDGFPRPDWSMLRTMYGHDRELWDDVVRLWMSAIASRCHWACDLQENDSLVVLTPRELRCGRRMLEFATACRSALCARLPGVARFEPGMKTVMIGLLDHRSYYDYVGYHFPDEGRYGGSAGLQIRDDDFSHIAFVAVTPEHSALTDSTVAHELVHASLAHRSMPQWIEEGLAQMFQGDAVPSTRRQPTLQETVACRQFWRRAGLEKFWSGAAFTAPDRMQGHAYLLAEILVRNIVTSHRRGWFGFGRQKHERLLRFLDAATFEDAGASAFEAELGRSLDDLTDEFLGTER